MKRSEQYRKIAINLLLAVTISLVLNFSYLVFMMVGTNNSEPAPSEPAKPRTELSVESRQSDGESEMVAEISADSLRKQIIIREENIARQSRERNNISPLTTQMGRQIGRSHV